MIGNEQKIISAIAFPNLQI